MNALVELHRTDLPLVLPNAWDAASARIVEDAGFKAIATPSAGVAWSLGYQDGERMPADEMIAAIARVARVVHIPVTADVEGGYAASTDDLLRFVERVAAAGAVGINLEDWDPRADDYLTPDVAARRVRAIKRRFGDAIFVNARTNTFLNDPPSPERRAKAIARLAAFVDAGADGVFEPGLVDDDDVAAVASAVRAPLNVLVHRPDQTVARLRSLGVARISLGPRVIQRALGEIRAVVAGIARTGSFAFVGDAGMLSFAEAEALFEKGRRP